MPECMIPPWVRPESPETLRIIDDATVAFQPAFGRGMTQRGIFADPRWGLRRRYRGLRSEERAALQKALNDTRGQLSVLRVTPHAPLRGSMSSTELLTNNTFASGTTGWSAGGSDWTLSSSDRVLRATRAAVTGGGQMLQASSAVTLVAYAPYVLRYMISQGRGSFSTGHSGNYSGTSNFGASSTSFGLYDAATVLSNTSVTPGIVSSDTSGMTAGDYFDIPYISLARCALVDGGGNALLQSDDYSQAAWTKTNVTISADTGLTVAPDGTSTADNIVETTANSTHSVSQARTFASAADDISFSVALKVNGRTHCWLQLSHATGSTFAFFNLSTGAVGTTSTGSGWSNLRTFSTNLGNGWWQFCIVVRKTSADTSVTIQHGGGNGDGVSSYTGSTSAGMFAWRATCRNSSVPTRLIQSTASNVPAVAQSGSGIYTKGWPASTSGLLLTGDWIELNGELKQITAPVTSDAGGLAYINFRPALAADAVNDDPIVIYEPFGRFIYPAGSREIENMFGSYSDCEMNLEEVYS